MCLNSIVNLIDFVCACIHARAFETNAAECGACFMYTLTINKPEENFKCSISGWKKLGLLIHIAS